MLLFYIIFANNLRKYALAGDFICTIEVISTFVIFVFLETLHTGCANVLTRQVIYTDRGSYIGHTVKYKINKKYNLFWFFFLLCFIIPCLHENIIDNWCFNKKKYFLHNLWYLSWVLIFQTNTSDKKFISLWKLFLELYRRKNQIHMWILMIRSSWLFILYVCM